MIPLDLRGRLWAGATTAFVTRRVWVLYSLRERSMVGGSGFAVEMAAAAKAVGQTAVAASCDDRVGPIVGRNVDEICVISTGIYVLSLLVPAITHTLRVNREVESLGLVAERAVV